jgi:hypothetical protein
MTALDLALVLAFAAAAPVGCFLAGTSIEARLQSARRRRARRLLLAG